MPRRTSLSMPHQTDNFEEQKMIGMDSLVDKAYGDDVDIISVDDLDPPTQLCCGKDKLLCFSSKLHGSIFVVSIIFMVFYIVTSSCAWIFYGLYTYTKDPFGLVFYLNVSLSLRLVLSIILLVASLTRHNFWLMIYVGGSVVALLLFCGGISQPEPLLLLCAPVVIASDFIMFYIIRRFVVENQYFPIILAEKKQRYNTTIRRLLREAKKEDEYQALKEGILKNAQASKEASRQKSIVSYPKTPRPRSMSSPKHRDAKLSIDALLMQTNHHQSTQVAIGDQTKPNDWKHLFLKGTGKFWPTAPKMAETGTLTGPLFTLDSGAGTGAGVDHESKRTILRNRKSMDEKINVSKMETNKDINKEEKDNTIEIEPNKDVIKAEKGNSAKPETQKEIIKEEKNNKVKMEMHKEIIKDEKSGTNKLETKTDVIKDEKSSTSKLEMHKDNKKDEKINTSKVKTHKDEKMPKDEKPKPSGSTASKITNKSKQSK